MSSNATTYVFSNTSAGAVASAGHLLVVTLTGFVIGSGCAGVAICSLTLRRHVTIMMGIRTWLHLHLPTCCSRYDWGYSNIDVCVWELGGRAERWSTYMCIFTAI